MAEETKESLLRKKKTAIDNRNNCLESLRLILNDLQSINQKLQNLK